MSHVSAQAHVQTTWHENESCCATLVRGYKHEHAHASIGWECASLGMQGVETQLHTDSDRRA